MTDTRFRKVFLAVVSVIMLMGVLCTSVFAADQFKNQGLKYGEIVPTNSKLSAQVKNYNFYGDSGKLYVMRISKGVPGARFAVEIYADSQYKHQIRAYNEAFSATAGNKPLSIGWSFKTLNSGTYYGRCYTYTKDGDNNVIDTASLKTFTIKIDRLAKREVNLSSVKNTASGPKITWQQVPTATQYRVYRKASGEKNWKLLYKAGANATAYTDKTAKSGTQYTYTVKCTDGKFTSLYNKKGLSIRYLSQPTLVSVNGSGSAGYAKLTWKAVPGAQGYYIYRKGGSLSNYEWVNITTVKNGKTTSYTDKKATSSDWNYTYTVKAYYGKNYSSHNANGIDFDYVAAPKLTKVTPHTQGMQITWTSDNPNVTKYYVYRKNGKSWKKIGTTASKSFIDKTAVSNTTYTYTVKAATDTNSGAYNNSGKSGKFLGTPALKSLTFDSKNRAVVKWNAVNGASSYRVYRKIDGAKNWTLIATVKGAKTVSYYDACAKQSGQKFTYTVRAVDSKNKTGAYIKDGITSTHLTNPVFTVIQQDNAEKTLAAEIKWEAVKGATYYRVYRRIPGGSWETLVKETTRHSHIDATLQSGVAYEYAVRAFAKDGSSKYTAKPLTAVAIPVISDVTIGENGVTVNWSAVDGATYNIYRSPFGTNEFTLLGTADTPAYIDSTDGAKVTGYDYCVTAVVNKTEGVKSTKMSNVAEISATATLTTVKDEETGISETFVKLVWDSPLAESVIITKAAGNDDPVELGVYTAELYKEFDDKSVAEGNTYTYSFTAQAQNKINGTATVSIKYPLPALNAAKITELTPDYNNGAPVCRLSWLPVDFASEYKVFRSENNTDYTEVGTVNAAEIIDGMASFTDSIDAEIAYTYKIQAISAEDREASLTEATTEICVYAPLASLADLKAVGALDDNEAGEPVVHITLSWAETKYAEEYIIERKTGDSEVYEELQKFILTEGSALPLSFTDTTAQVGVSYTYRVTAKNINRGSVSNEVSYLWNS